MMEDITFWALSQFVKDWKRYFSSHRKICATESDFVTGSMCARHL